MEHSYSFERLPKDLQDKFEIYRKTLIKWNSHINLVSKTTLSKFWTRHFEDSLQLFPFIRGERVLDVGSGAGFPGMILAMAGQSPEFLEQEHRSPFRVDCIDSDVRKIMFLNEIARLTATIVYIIYIRVEQLSFHYDTAVARGFASLKDSLKLMAKTSDYFVFLKGEKFQEEIEEAQKCFKFDYQVYDSCTDSRGKIITITSPRAI